MASSAFSLRRVARFFVLLGCLVLVHLESCTVQAHTSGQLYERDLSRLSKLRMERRLDTNNRLRPRASVVPPSPAVYLASIPDTLPFATCPTLVGELSLLYAPRAAAFGSSAAEVYCGYSNFDGIYPQCIYDPLSGIAIMNLDESDSGTAICGTLL